MPGSLSHFLIFASLSLFSRVTREAESLLFDSGNSSPKPAFPTIQMPSSQCWRPLLNFLVLAFPLWASSLWWARWDPLIWHSFWHPHSLNPLFELFIHSLSHTSFSQNHLVGAALLCRGVTDPSSFSPSFLPVAQLRSACLQPQPWPQACLMVLSPAPGSEKFFCFSG